MRIGRPVIPWRIEVECERGGRILYPFLAHETDRCEDRFAELVSGVGIVFRSVSLWREDECVCGWHRDQEQSVGAEDELRWALEQAHAVLSV